MIEKTVAATVQDLMVDRGYTLAIAESCTGGMLCSSIADNPGSSAYFDRGYICYSYRSKTEMLQISAALIEEKGAVSIEVAEAMAISARKLSKTDFGLAVTGIAGPDGGTREKPVGTVAFALATPQAVFSKMLILPKLGRMPIRKNAVAIALDMLRHHLLSEVA